MVKNMNANNVDIRADEQSFRLLSRNYGELKRLLDKTEDIRTAIKLGSREDIMEEVAFMLHNYASSAMSLVAHTSRLNNKLYKNRNPKALKEIETEIGKRFVDNEIHQIVQGLRDYTQHRKLPIVGRLMSYNAFDHKPKLEAAYYLSTESLLEWDGWKSLAKQKLDKLKSLSLEDRMLKHHTKDIPINTLITDHYKEVSSFYEWLGNKRRESFKKIDN